MCYNKTTSANDILQGIYNELEQDARKASCTYVIAFINAHLCPMSRDLVQNLALDLTYRASFDTFRITIGRSWSVKPTTVARSKNAPNYQWVKLGYQTNGAIIIPYLLKFVELFLATRRSKLLIESLIFRLLLMLRGG